MTRSIGLYIHIPFCRQKCLYCSFWSIPVHSEGDLVRDYVNALIREMTEAGPRLMEKGVRTVYIGGGTPSLLPPTLLEKLLGALAEIVPVLGEGECTLEANPGTMGKDTLAVLAKSPVNRLSLGIQSANNDLLRKIGRIHTWEDAQTAYAGARQAGIDNISVDLIYGLPGQDREDWQRTLAQVGSLAPDHVSAYGLQVEENTPLAEKIAAGEWQLPPEDEEAQMADDATVGLAAQGLIRYEISSYCRPGRESRHNLIYWHNEPYIGLGAGAFSFLNGARSSNVHDPAAYIQRVTYGQALVDWQETVTHSGEMEETMMMTLRLTEGLSVPWFCERFQLDPLDVFAVPLERLSDQGLLTVSAGRIKPTALGLRFNNRIGREFIGSLA